MLHVTVLMCLQPGRHIMLLSALFISKIHLQKALLLCHTMNVLWWQLQQSFWHEDPQAALVKPVISLSSFFLYILLLRNYKLSSYVHRPLLFLLSILPLSPAHSVLQLTHSFLSLSPSSPSALWVSGMQLHKSEIKLDHQDDEQSGWRAFEMNTKAGEVQLMSAGTAEECCGLRMNSPHLWIYRFSVMNKNWVEVTINKLFPLSSSIIIQVPSTKQL